MRHLSPIAALGLALSAACMSEAVPLHADTAVEQPVQAPAMASATTVTGAAATPVDASTPGAGHDSAAVAPDPDPQREVADMEDRVLAQQAQIRRLEESLDAYRDKANAAFGESFPDQFLFDNTNGMSFGVLGQGTNYAKEVPLVWRRLSLLVNVDFEYTSQYNNTLSQAGGPGDDFIQPLTPNGAEGMYFGHTDLLFNYQFNGNMFGKLEFDPAALALEDVGVGWQELPFPPLTSGWGDYTYSIFVGQKRQYFGIEQQTDDRYLLFPNRAMMFGGPNPFGTAKNPGKDPFGLYTATPTLGDGNYPTGSLIAELVYQRTLGVHIYHAHDFSFLAYNLGVDIVNDESENSLGGGGTDSLKTGFPLQVDDQDVSEIGRLGLEPHIPLPFGAKFNFGASAFHDPENTSYYASQPDQEEWSDAQGLDATFQTDRGVLYLQSEYVKRDQYGPSYTTPGLLTNNEYGGLQGRAEGYYVAGSFQPWRILDPAAPQVELLARYEGYHYDDVSPWLQDALGPYTGSYNATTIALKYTYQGNCHTSVNYTTYGLNNNFNGTGATALLQLEQQVSF